MLTTCPSAATATLGEKVRSAVKGSGGLPACPHAPRSLSWSIQSTSKKSSSLITYESCALGYTTRLKSRPNAELSSMRTAAVAKRRFLQPICSWT